MDSDSFTSGQKDCQEGELNGSALQGLLIAVPLGLLLWCLIAACVKWPILGVAVGVAFAALCFWLAWQRLGESDV